MMQLQGTRHSHYWNYAPLQMNTLRSLLLSAKMMTCGQKIPLGFNSESAWHYVSFRTACQKFWLLRKTFPATPHQFHTRCNEPKSLCIYLDRWSRLERTMDSGKTSHTNFALAIRNLLMVLYIIETSPLNRYIIEEVTN